MYKKTITYVDYDGNKRTEDHWFHLTEAELTMMNMSYAGGMQKRIDRIISSQNGAEIMRVFQDILRKSYGVKSDDGRRFIKSDEIFTDFEQTEAYSQLFMELCTDSKSAAEFVNNVIPKDLAAKVEKEKEKITPLPGTENK